jgi:hypothetical protein
MQSDNVDVRILRIGSHDANIGSLSENGAAFEIDLGNVLQQVGANVTGFSVESVGFYNLQPLINAGTHDRLVISVEDYNAGQPFLVVLSPGNYTPEDLATELNAQISLATDGNVDLNATADADGHFSFSQTLPIAQDAEIRFYSEGVSAPGLAQVGNALLPILGFPPRQSVWESLGTLLRAPAHWDLGQQRVAYVHSSYLMHDRSAVDGEGLQMSAFCSCPINVGYGSFNLVFPNQYDAQAVRWQRTHSVRAINLRLRTIRGELFNLQGTEWFLTLKLWITRN